MLVNGELVINKFKSLCRHTVINRQFSRLFRQTNESARNILHTNIVYLKASADVKSQLFGIKMGRGDEAVDHEHGPIV